MSNLVELVSQQEQLFLPVVSDSEIAWDREKQFAIQALQNNEFLGKVATQNPTSLQNAIINVASVGISLNPALKHAYLLPRKGGNKQMGVCLDISYMGLLHIAQSSGVILWGQSKLVYQNDIYENVGIDKAPVHKQNPFSDRGLIVGAYCTVKTVDGDFLTEEMSVADIFAIRDRSEAFKKGYGPWKTDEGEMIRKTVVKRAYKYWPKCERLGEAIQMLNTDGGEGIVEKDITPQAISAEQVDLLFPLLCGEDGYFNKLGEKMARAFKFNSLGEISANDFDKVLSMAQGAAQ